MVGALFADVVGSTSLGERLDPELVADRVGDVIGTVVLAVEANGGLVKDIAGDGVLALFEQPPDAARAAAAVLDGVRRVTAEGQDAAGLAIRVGAAVGAVRVGEVRGSDRMRATGPAITLAMRLEGCAEPGTALVSDDLVAVTAGIVADPSDRAEDANVLRSVPDVCLAPVASRRAGAPAGSAVGDRREERRTVVALFAAVAKAAADDPDDENDDGVVEEALARGVEVVERFGGTVKDLAGDVVVALFGAPTAHDDDRERAVLAGLALRDELPVAVGGAVEVRVGVASGRVVVGAVGAGQRVEYGAMGDAMNTAARLEANAAGGVVLVAEAARTGILDAFEWGPPCAVAAKGKRVPVVAHPALGPSHPPPVLPRSGGTGPDEVFVGRSAELSRLEALVDARGRLLIEGDAGVGKSALVRAAARRHPAAPAWLLVRGASWNRDRHLGAWLPLTPGGVLPATSRARQEQLEARTAEVVCRRLAEAAHDGVTALVVEDVQWLDEGSCRVLAEVAEDAPMAVVCTTRPGTSSPVPGAAVLVLGPLRPPDDRRLLDAVVGEATLPFDDERRILDAAGGNPLVLHAQLQARAASAHFLDREEDVPESIERLVLLRVDALAVADRAIVDALAVAGVPCTTSQLAAIVGDRDVAAVDGRIEELARTGLVVVDGARTSLAHGAFGDAIRSAILQRTRRELHRRAASVLAPSDAGTGARHWARAGEPAEAAALAERAAEEASARVSYQEAASLFELAGRAGEEAGHAPERTAGRWLQAGRCHLAAAALDAAMDAFARASELAIVAGDAATSAAAAVGYEDAMFETRRPRASSSDRGRRLLDAALAGAADLDDAARARLLAASGRELRFAVGPDEAAGITDDAVALARASGDPATTTYALTAWRVAREVPEALGARSTTDAELVAAAAAAGDEKLEFEARRLVLMDQLAAGDLPHAWAQVRALSALADRLGERRLAWLAPMWRAAELLVHGPLAGALSATADVYDAGRRAAYNDILAVHALQEYLARRHLGSSSEVASRFARVQAFAGERWQVFQASLCAELGDLDGARAALDAVEAQPDVLLGGDRVVGAAIAMVTDAVVALGDAHAAARLSARLRPWAGQHVVVGTGAAYLGPVDFVLGRLAAVEGDEDRAREHHRAALAQARVAGATVAVGECALGLASLVGRADGARLAEEAFRIGQSTGSRRLVEAAARLRRRDGGGATG